MAAVAAIARWDGLRGGCRCCAACATWATYAAAMSARPGEATGVVADELSGGLQHRSGLGSAESGGRRPGEAGLFASERVRRRLVALVHMQDGSACRSLRRGRPPYLLPKRYFKGNQLSELPSDCLSARLIGEPRAPILALAKVAAASTAKARALAECHPHAPISHSLVGVAPCVLGGVGRGQRAG